jgi:hypothetical protein
MFALVAMTALAAPLVLIAADKPPHFDLRPTCQSAARLDPTEATIKGCMDVEEGARKELDAQWLSFRAGDRQSCTAETQAGGPPTYVELLVCLQDAKAASELESRGSEALGDIGQRPMR